MPPPQASLKERPPEMLIGPVRVELFAGEKSTWNFHKFNECFVGSKDLSQNS